MSQSFIGLGDQVRSLFTKPRSVPKIPARPRLGILSFAGGARFQTANICLRRSTPAGYEKLSNALNTAGGPALQEAKFERRLPADNDRYSCLKKREARERNGVGRPPKDKTREGRQRHYDLVDQVNRDAREAARAKAEAQIHAG